MRALLCLSVVACAPEPGGDASREEPTPIRDTGPAPASEPEQRWTDDHACPAAGPLGLPPCVTLRGAPNPDPTAGTQLNGSASIVPFGSRLPGGCLSLSLSGGETRHLVFHGLPAPGEHLVDAPDGDALVPRVHNPPQPAGDVDGDGWTDLWLDGHLALGPLVGEVDPDAVDVALLYQPGGRSGHLVGGFDVDGDAHDDAVESGRWGATVYFGPFEGLTHMLESERATVWVDSEVNTARIALDYFGAERHALSVTRIEYGSVEGLYVFDLGALGRGDSIGQADATASGWLLGGRLIGDVDGDGHGDLATDLALLPGPLEGDVSSLPATPIRSWYPATCAHVLGDMTGDGVGELLCQDFDMAIGGLRLHVVDPTVEGGAVPDEHWVRIDPAVLDRVSPLPSWAAPEGVLSGDLDGDGLAELVLVDAAAEDGGVALIYRGADLFAR